MHLTNYSINKKHKIFSTTKNECDGTVSHKRSVIEVFETLKKEGHNVNKLRKNIKKLIIKTLAVG